MELFVPGRICLFGEHSDWAGGYRRINGEVEKGYTIITGTNQGLYARVKPHPSKLVIHSTLDDGTQDTFEVSMDRDKLLAVAESGRLFSYAAGVAYQVLTHYRVQGLEIENHKTDLPVKKGLSSSAAVCVLVARAFNRMYNLKMTVRGEMEFAYLGEITTPSRCGRMDQGCAYGNRPIMMTFDGERTDVEELSIPKDLHFVIVDLCKEKDTREILSRLNHCYPFADDEVQKGVQEYLGPISAKITHEAVEAFRAGDAVRIGALMREAQAEFDKYCIPACPSQLTSPYLHKLLEHPPLQPFVLGGKGVGSQGDGTAQFIVQDEESQKKAIEVIERDFDMSCLKLTINAARQIRKAVIPAAGFGTRLFPATKALKKEFFPVVGRDGRMKPVIMHIVEEAVSAGVNEIGIIIQKRDKKLFEDFFHFPPSVENFNKLSKENQKYSEYIQDIGRKVKFLYQKSQDGFGHAVFCANKWVKGEPILLMLGDHIYSSQESMSCAQQLLEVYKKTGKSVIGLKPIPTSEVRHFGCATGNWMDGEDILEITEFAEKPDEEYARQHLTVEKYDADTIMSVFGLYVLTPRVFDILEENIRCDRREGGEFQLTSALEELRKQEGFMGYVVKGDRFDVGIPDAYRQTMIDLKKA